ncbi:MAG: hypothetical protein EOR77_30790 [Mesorhizobium sp.]|uniref:hypothetical protein n=1 Tax=Mesorhizobium sp. TaxID=1871066 RepID=UPI000FE60007|nr:hypothetical protein [Mesorhizobium sp.]RWM27909.1 MAG: hypothetical protein EOR77_30790 [Mesorhizobium sp.]
MIRVFYDSATGAIAYTVSTQREDEQPASSLPYIDIEAMPAGDIMGYKVEDGALVPTTDLTALQALAKEYIDAQAENVRSRFITLGSGQAMVYQQKRLEAEAYMADPEIAPGEIPHLVREAALNDIPLFDQAVIVLTMAEQWKVVSSYIEDFRLAAKKAVALATTPAAIDVAKQIDWSPIMAFAQ